jgi:ferredoxin
MPFVVTEPCINCKHTDCVAVCPMDCFVEGPNFLAIDPTQCIDCSVCVPECPVDAIVSASEIDEAQRPFVALNAALARDARWPRLTRRKPPLDDHARWAAVAAKRHLLERP